MPPWPSWDRTGSSVQYLDSAPAGWGAPTGEASPGKSLEASRPPHLRVPSSAPAVVGLSSSTAGMNCQARHISDPRTQCPVWPRAESGPFSPTPVPLPLATCAQSSLWVDARDSLPARCLLFLAHLTLSPPAALCFMEQTTDSALVLPGCSPASHHPWAAPCQFLCWKTLFSPTRRVPTPACGGLFPSAGGTLTASAVAVSTEGSLHCAPSLTSVEGSPPPYSGAGAGAEGALWTPWRGFLDEA